MVVSGISYMLPEHPSEVVPTSQKGTMMDSCVASTSVSLPLVVGNVVLGSKNALTCFLVAGWTKTAPQETWFATA